MDEIFSMGFELQPAYTVTNIYPTPTTRLSRQTSERALRRRCPDEALFFCGFRGTYPVGEEHLGPLPRRCFSGGWSEGRTTTVVVVAVAVVVVVVVAAAAAAARAVVVVV